MAGNSCICSKWPCGKYTTKLPLLGKDVRGPAQACHSSKQIEEVREGEGEEVKAEAEEEEAEEAAEEGASSSSVVLRSIRAAI